MKRYLDIYKRYADQNEFGCTQEEYERQCQNFENVKQREISPIDEIFKTPELYKKYTKELERRKIENTETLRSYGLDL